MFQRIINLPEKQHFFLFGARGTGKSTLLRALYPNAILIDLLSAAQEDAFLRDPDRLERQVAALGPESTHVVIDEIQKVPKLLDVVHRLIETPDLGKSFIMTGSSARRLKLSGANLLAGRAFVRNLFPLVPEECGSAFKLQDALRWGTLPRIFHLSADEEKRDFLEAYTLTYLKEEIWAEQIVRKLDPFRRFIEVAAQQNGKIINASRIATDVGADPKTVQSYFQILEDTLLGFHLDAFHTSVRKRIRAASKFYFFDVGVSRALARSLRVEPVEQTSYFGEVFEQFIVSTLYALNQYRKTDYRFTYLQTAGGAEIDLVVERPGRSLALVEIKSATTVKEEHLRRLKHFESDFPDAEFYLISRDARPQKVGKIQLVPWELGLSTL